MIPIKNNLKRANAARIFFYLLVALSITSFYSHFLQYQLLVGLKNGVGITAQAASENNTRQQMIALINVLLLIASSVLFLVWVYRAYDNLYKLGVTNLSCTPGWAIGYWFVPIMSLFKPFVVMKEIWDETQLYVLPIEEKRTAIKSYTVGIWWTLYLMSIVSSYVVAFMVKGRETSNDGLITITIAGMCSTAFIMFVKITTLIMINKIVVFEKRLLEYVNNTSHSQVAENMPIQ